MTIDGTNGAGAVGRIAIGELVIDRERFRVTVAGELARLTYMEFQALHVIAGAEGRVVAYEALAEALWGTVIEDHRRRLAVLVSRIRAKLGSSAPSLQRVRQVGYRLAARRS